MTGRFRAVLLAMIAPLVLMGCVLTPGKFTSTLTIKADRSFTFAYQGEVIAIDLAAAFAEGMAAGLAEGAEGDDDTPSDDADPAMLRTAWQDAGKTSTGGDSEAKFAAIAEALRKEPGYRSVEYKGDGLFVVDFQTSGRLTHSFVYPYNIDAEILFPFLAIELRGRDQVRVSAPLFGGDDSAAGGMASGMAGKDSPTARRDGSFTLITDGEIVAQNNEGGATTSGAERRVTWRVTPATKTAPMAVVKVAPLP